jgi:predicted TIM-barrel fold metal-dependent hydrolase
VHIIRIILGGVFDRYPKLQIVIGHLGLAGIWPQRRSSVRRLSHRE